MITLPETTAYLLWYDDTPKRTQAQKIGSAAERYRERFGERPTVALVALGEVVSVEGIVVRGSAYVGKNNVQVGRE